MKRRLPSLLHGQDGSTAVEFAVIVVVFFTMIFGIIELGRMIFIFNAVQDVTRRAASAAAMTSFNDTSKLSKVRQNAIYRSTAGSMPLNTDITDAAVRIDYLWINRSDAGELTLQEMGSAVPSSMADNHLSCRADPYSAGCVRFVRVRICDPSSPQTCTPIDFKTMTRLVNFTFPIHFATTITPMQ